MVAFGRFAVVGASGVLVNLVVFAATLQLLHPGALPAAAIAYVVAAAHNYVWNRCWTFGRRHAPVRRQVVRFSCVSVAACVGAAALLALFRRAGVGDVGAQALAAVLTAPLSFAANRRWSFAAPDPPPHPAPHPAPRPAGQVR